MKQYIAHIALVVDDYDKAIDFYCGKLGFRLLEDTELTPEKRWVLVAPPGARESSLLIAKAANPRQTTSIGNQTGGRVGFFLFTDDFWRDFRNMETQEIEFVRPPKEEPYGIVAVFKDPFGNLWDLLQPNSSNKGIIKQE